MNVSDVNNDTLTFSLPVAPSGMAINSTGTVTWYPLYNQSGLWNVSIMVRDSSGLNVSQNFTLNVTRNNSAPNITTAAVINVTEDSIYIYDMNASDGENDTFTFNFTQGPNGLSINTTTGVLTFAPNNTQVGSYGVTVEVKDALNATGNQSFTLTVINNPPIINTSPISFWNESRLYLYDVNGSDEGDGISYYYLLQAPTNMSINATSGLISWTPNTSHVGLNNVTVRLNDTNGGIAEQNFTINVSRISNLSLRTSITPSSVNMSGQFFVTLNMTNNGLKNLTSPILTVSWNSSDVIFTSASINYTTINSTTAVWSNATNLSENSSIFLNITFTALNRSNNQSSNLSLQVTAMDGVIGLAANSTLTIQILFVNYVPIINSTPMLFAQSGTQYAYQAQAYDNNNDTLTYNLTQRPFNMQMNSTGYIVWYPLYNQSGLWNITLNVSDTRGGFALQNFTMNVTRNNSPPIFTTAAILNATQGANYSYDANATDQENDTFRFMLTLYPVGMSMENSTGVVSWVPRNRDVGSNNVTINATDSFGNSTAQSYALVVLNVAPNFTTSPVINGSEQAQYVYDANTTEEGDGNVLYSLAASPVGMSITNGSGVVSWTPNTTQTGLWNVSILFNDGNGAVVSQNYTLNISDRTAPRVNATFPPNTTKYAFPNVSVVFSASDNAQVERCNIVLNGVTTTIFSGGSNSQVNVSTSVNGSEGLNHLIVNCSDASGNWNSGSALFTVDTTPPALVISDPINNTNTSGNLNIVWTIVEPNFYNATLTYQNQVYNMSQSGSYNLIVNEGLYQNFTITTIDQLNRTNTSMVFFNVDRTPPRIVLVPNITYLIYDGRGAYVLFNATNSSDNYALGQVVWDFDSRDGIQNSSFGFEVYNNYSAASTYTATVRVFDVVGNVNQTTMPVHILRDSDGDNIPDFYQNGSKWDNCPGIPDPSNNASLCVGDRDGDGIPDPIDFITGSVNHTITNVPYLRLQVGNLTDPTNFSGFADVRLGNNFTYVYFPFNFTSDWGLEMWNTTLVAQPGALLFRGVVMPPNMTKTLYVPKANATDNAVCIADSNVETISSISTNCGGPSEYQVNCTGSNGAYACTDSGSYFTITGARFTAVRTFNNGNVPPSTPSYPVVSTGGGSGTRRYLDSNTGSRGGSSLPSFIPREYEHSDTAKVIVNSPAPSDGGASSAKPLQPKVQPIGGLGTDDVEVEVTNPDAIWVLLIAILIVAIGIIAIVFVWKM